MTKVQKWLLSSPQPTVIPKSKSIPLGLTEKAHRPQKGARKTRPSKSATNLLSGEKARLQVVFKPPFRFSVKICKNDKPKTQEKTKPDAERKRSENNLVNQAVVPTPVADATPSNNKTSKHSTNVKNILDLTPVPTAPKLEKSPKQESVEHKYANVLPRSSSDCKVAKKVSDAKIKIGHKKSNSVGQRKETTESRQNLISNEELGSNAHLYENVLFTPEVAKSCSMPRKVGLSLGIARQASHGHLPRARPRHPADTDHFYSTIETLRRTQQPPSSTNTSSSSGSSRLGNRPVRASRQNSLVDKPSRISDSKLKRQASEAELGRSIGFQLVVGKERLKRQLSDNELCRGISGSRGQLAMPMSAGAEPHRPFSWKRASLDCEASLPAPLRPRPPTYTFGELKNTAPDSTACSELPQLTPEEFKKILDM